jgi:signal transduction histidine kinase
MFGWAVADVMSDPQVLWDGIEQDDRRRMFQALRLSAATMSEWRCDFRIHRGRRDGDPGEERWMLGTAMPERLANGRTVWHGYVDDVTERRQLDRARHDAAVAEAANRAKTEFLSRMSHELRTPLNAVLGFAQLMEIDPAEPPGDNQKRRLKLIREAGEHLLHMIGDLLDLTRIESGGMALAPESVAVRELAAQTLELVRELADKAQVSLSLRPGPEITIVVDRTRLRQVLLNLLSNAIKYNRPGGRVEVVLVTGAGDDGRRLRIDIADTGLGIAEADLPQVFEPFQRGRHAQGAIEGAGIGLAVTRALVHLMGGNVHASSVVGEGSVFSLLLPTAPTVAPST